MSRFFLQHKKIFIKEGPEAYFNFIRETYKIGVGIPHNLAEQEINTVCETQEHFIRYYAKKIKKSERKKLFKHSPEDKELFEQILQKKPGNGVKIIRVLRSNLGKFFRFLGNVMTKLNAFAYIIIPIDNKGCPISMEEFCSSPDAKALY